MFEARFKAPPFSHNILQETKGYVRRREEVMDVDISNAKVIRYDLPGGSNPRLGVRQKRGERFQGVHYSGKKVATWSEREMVNTYEVTVLEEFLPSTSSLEELVGDAPVFLAEDANGVLWSFSLFGDAGGGYFVPSRMSLSLGVDRIPFEEDKGYWVREIIKKIDLSTVVPLFPRE